MRDRKAVAVAVIWCLVLGIASLSFGMRPTVKPFVGTDPLAEHARFSGPFVIVDKGGGITWVQPHETSACCPGDPEGGHGGEASGLPEGPETWCFENRVLPGLKGGPSIYTVSDTCGTNPPWDVLCFSSIDVRGLASQMGINFWHVDTYMGVNGGESYNGSYCLWCGSDSLWIDGVPVECNAWAKGKKPGYGNQWNCVVELDLGFTTAGTCTLAFDPRYDTECAYDYFYVEYYDGSEWQELAMFNGSSQSDLSVCGAGPNPDYFGFGDTGQPASADWVMRSVPGQPAFFAEIPGYDLPDNPRFRWRVATDGAWSDADGRGDTDGAAMIDNVLVQADGNVYYEDFEDGDWDSLEARGWSLVDPDGVLQAWHQEHDVDPPYEGGDGDYRSTCKLDSSITWRGRPIQGYPAGQVWRNGWFYRLMSPAVPVMNTGCVFQYDIYVCTMDYTCDYMDTKVRFYSNTFDRWCSWYDIDGSAYQGGCGPWLIDFNEDVTSFYGADYDSVMLCWDLMDLSNPGDFCQGKHKSTDFLMDNLSVGFYDADATWFRFRMVDMLHDTFHDSLPAFNSYFGAYYPDTLAYYSGPPYTNALPREQQLYGSVTDKDGVVEVRLYGSVDRGETWIYKSLTLDVPVDPDHPELGGDYYGTFLPTDFGLTRWDKGTEVRYYLRCEDGLTNLCYFPSDADPYGEGYTGDLSGYFSFSVLPMYPPEYTGSTILLVDGYGADTYDYAACMAADSIMKPLEEIYGETLEDAGYAYDTYNILGAGGNVHLQPVEYDAYDALIWFTGPENSRDLLDKEAQDAIWEYLEDGGKVVLCGDRIAYDMFVNGRDSLYGEFLGGIMGAEYLDEMGGGFELPYLYAQAVDTVSVFGNHVAIGPDKLDSLVIYRGCPQLKDMSYVVTTDVPPWGYEAQPLLHLLNPDPMYDPSDMAIYVEKESTGGQCVFVDFDLSASVNHVREECDGSPTKDLPSFFAGAYFGRVDLMLTILEELFGLAPPYPGGGGGQAGTPTGETYRWALGQNIPNPFVSSTLIGFEVARTGRVSIKVYNAMGQLVQVLENRRMEPGRYSVGWDGTNRAGETVSAGVYFYTMEAGGFSATKKILILRH